MMFTSTSLDDLFDEVREMDVSDPVCMEKVLDYWEQLIEESDSYTELIFEKLKNTVITWRQPWYQIPCITKTPVKNDDEGDFIDGRITQKEADYIDKRWRKLRKKFNLPDNLGCFARWKRRKGYSAVEVSHVRSFIASYLARGLQRTVRQVYLHILNHYGKPRRGMYSKDEQKIMDICFYHNPKKAPVILSDVLLREPRAIYYRLNSSINGKYESKRIKWNNTLATKLLKLLMNATGESLEGLKNKKIGIDIWRSFEGDFETLGEYLRYFWYNKLHCQLFCKCDVTMKRVRRKVFKIFKRSTYQVWTDIRWKDVVAEFPDGFTFQFIYWITKHIFRENRIHTKLPVHELAKIGLNRSKNTHHGNKRLNTLCLNKDGNLEEIRYDNKLK